MHIHLDARAEHPHRVGDAILAVHEKMLAHGMDNGFSGGQVDGLGVLNDILNVLVGDLAVGGHDGMEPRLLKPRMWAPVTPR